MKRIEKCTKGMVLSCAALAFVFAGCTSSGDSGTSGSLDATLTLDATNNIEQINDIFIDICCYDPADPALDPLDPCGSAPAIDPKTKLPWPAETIQVNVEFTEGLDPNDPKDTTGILQKEGLPPGDCIIDGVADSLSGDLHCEGSDTVSITANATAYTNILFNCVNEARYGGVRVDGTFNQCAEYEQIIVSPTAALFGHDINVDTWIYDADGDDVSVGVQFLLLDPITGAPTATSCGTVTPPLQMGTPVFTDPHTKLAATATCEVAGDCLILVGVSDDLFSFCDATNAAASAAVPVTCQTEVICGDGIVEGPEQCDPCDDISGCDPTTMPPGTGSPVLLPTAFCDAQCRIIDNCSPNPCEGTPSDNGCVTPTCTADPVTNVASCTYPPDSGANGEACSPPTGGSCNDGTCELCDPADPNACPAATDCRQAATCDPLAGCQAGMDEVDGTPCATDAPFVFPGECTAGECFANGACLNANDIPITSAPTWQDDVETCALWAAANGGLGMTGECLVADYGITPDCAQCYEDVTICGAVNCGSCAVDPASAACLDCVAEQCTVAFNLCAFGEVCGDSVVDPVSEVCDDGVNDNSSGSCRWDCSAAIP